MVLATPPAKAGTCWHPHAFLHGPASLTGSLAWPAWPACLPPCAHRYTNARGEGKFFSFDLLDAQGGEIRVVCWNDQVRRGPVPWWGWAPGARSESSPHQCQQLVTTAAHALGWISQTGAGRPACHAGCTHVLPPAFTHSGWDTHPPRTPPAPAVRPLGACD